MRRQWVGRALASLAMACTFVAGAPTLAADGKLEIDQSCVAVGCFPGDTAGLPVQITNPGSYVLTGNLVSSGPTLIQITSSFVSLDLGGFQLSAFGPAMAAGVRIEASDIEVKNGAIANLDAAGILNVGSGSRLSLHALRIFGITNGPGIDLGSGSFNQVRNSTVFGNGGGIVATGNTTTIEGCSVAGASGTADGIRVGDFSLIAGNVASFSFGDGIEVGLGSVVRGNVTAQNGESGIQAASETLIIGNTALNNAQIVGGSGNIAACASCTLVDNHTE
jgi:hypothetical protein